MKNRIIAHNGSVQYIPEIPDDVKAIYKTVWEISQKKVLDLAADRGAFICQSQSLNVHLQAPTVGQLTSMHFYGWKRGLKTGMYYLRTKPASQAIQFTLDHNLVKETKKAQDKRGAQKVETSKVSEKEGAKANLDAPTAKASTDVAVKPQSGLNTPPPESDTSPVVPVQATSQASTESSRSSPGPATPADIADAPVDLTKALESMNLDEKTKEAAAKDPEFAAALLKAQERKIEEEKLMCSLENKEACLMCSA